MSENYEPKWMEDLRREKLELGEFRVNSNGVLQCECGSTQTVIQPYYADIVAIGQKVVCKKCKREKRID